MTRLLDRWRGGDRGALGELVDEAYLHLRQLAERAMRGERREHTLQATALVHEAYLRLTETAAPHFRDRQHFFATAALVMRRILVDHARRLRAERRGGGWCRVTLGDTPEGAASAVDLLALDEALDELARLDERKARVVELRYFGGLSVAETADVLAVSKPTVILDTRLARAFLFSRVQGAGGAG